MRTFAQKQSQPQQKSSVSQTRSNTFPTAASPSASPLLYLQRTIENQATLPLLQARANRPEAASDTEVSPATEIRSEIPATTRFAHDFSRMPVHSAAPITIQPKLTVNTPGDIYEQEADHIAEQVMRMPEPKLQRACACGGRCAKCQPDRPSQEPVRLQTKHVGSSHAGQTAAPPIVHDVLASSGQPLDASTRAFMEPRFGHDFSRVRVHSDAAAEQSARDVNANAYTVGQNIVFGPSRFAPGTQEGRRLIAHELTHVIQQRAGARSTLRRSLAGCQNLVKEEKGLGLLSGRLVHSMIAADFKSGVKGAVRREVRIPGASAGPLRTDDLCGKPSSQIDPEEIGGTNPKAGVGIPDLARITAGRVLQVAEVKPAALVCLVDGENQFLRYIDQGNARDPNQASWRASMGIDVVSPLSRSEYPPRTFSRSTPAGMAIINTDWCSPGLLAYSVSLKGKPTRTPVPVRVPVPVPASKPVRVRLDGYHPFFEDLVNRLPYMEALPGREFVVVIADGFYRQVEMEAQRQSMEQQRRLLRPDPRGMPIMQLGIPVMVMPRLMMYVAVASAAVATAAIAVTAIPLAVGATAAAGAAATTTEIVAAPAIAWGLAKPLTAAAVVTLTLGQASITEAKAVFEVMKPLIGKSLLGAADVTTSPELANSKPGQAITIQGQAFRAIIRLKTPN